MYLCDMLHSSIIEHAISRDRLVYLPLWHVLYLLNRLSKLNLLYSLLNQSDSVLDRICSVRDPSHVGLHELRQLDLVIWASIRPKVFLSLVFLVD